MNDILAGPLTALLTALLNGILVSAALAFVVGVTLRLLPATTLNSATRYAIWWIVLAVTVALPLSYFRPAGNSSLPSTAVAHAIPIRTTHAMESQPRALKLKSAVSTSPVSDPAPRLPGVTFPLALPAGLWPDRIMTIWLITSLLALIRLAWSAILLERRKARAAVAPAIRSVRVVISSEISIPLVAGPWKRCIMFPARLLDELDPQELEQIGIHEAAHLLRGDDYALLIQRTLEAIFALHPVVRWLSHRIDLEREIACDDLVIAATGDPQPYAACLARVVQLTGGIRATPIATSAADRSHLARRVDLLLDQTRHCGTRLLGLRLTLATICLSAMSWGAVQMPGLISFAATPTRVKQPTAAFIQAPPPLLAQAAAPRPALPPTTPEPVTPVLVSPVLVPIVVRDPLGRFVTGLDQSTFKIKEDGIEQVTSEVSQPPHSDDRADLFVVVGSEVNPDPTLEPLLAEKVQVSRSVDIVQVHGLGQLQPDTSPLAAILAVENRLRHISKNQGVLLVTNSAAATERYTDADLQSTAGIDMPVYVLDLSGPADIPVQAFLKELAARTGGDYIPVKQEQEIPDLLAKTVIAVLNEYVLTYTPTNPSRDGAYRSLEISFQQPRGLPPLTLHYRSGYNAPAQ
jgi:beta-lactamase regulating signal transducer with metallopeptidase domain